MTIPFLVPLALNPDRTTPITPGFPRWEKSFVSGTHSILFKVTHRISIEDPHLLHSAVRFLPASEGPPGHVHGGATAALLDETMGIVVWHQPYPSLTQSMQAHYLRPIPLDSEATLLTRVVTIGDRTVEVHATVFGSDYKPCVTAQGIFHRLSAEQLARFMRTSGRP